MALRATKKTGLYKIRHQDPNLQRAFDGIIERIEVLDGVKGDTLDRAVTYRDLEASGFDISVPFGGGVPLVTNTPGPGDGTPVPTTGAAAAPSNLAANETFLAILLTWTNPSFNLQHIEVWRNTVDNLSTAVFIGTAIASTFIDYVGASASFYYWVRSIGTDGTASAFNAAAGTLGTTGIDPSDFEVELNISALNLDAALAARIDLIDVGPTALTARLTIAEGDIVAAESDITLLQSDAAALLTTVDGHTTSISGNASSISSNETNIVQLTTDVINAEGDIIANAAGIAANASSILNLEATVGALDPEGGETWEFDTTLEGWTAANATATGPTGGALIFLPQAGNPSLSSPAFTLTGGIFTQVVMRVRQTIGGGTWEGNCFYSTPGHGISDSFKKTIPDPGLSLSVWQTLTWDMTDLTAGGSDWVDSEINTLRFDLVSDFAAKFEVDFIFIAKFSSTAFSAALDALDVRVTANEGSILAQGTRLTLLEATVDDPVTGVVATTTALNALIIDVASNVSGVSANAAAINALQSTVNDPVAGVVVNASAITVLQTNVSSNETGIESNASSVTQLSASIDGGFPSVINPLTVLNDAFGTTFIDSEIQAYSIGSRAGVAGTQVNSNNDQNFISRQNGDRIRIEPRGIYEIRFSLYHNRATDNGSFFFGLHSYAALTGGTVQNVKPINNNVLGFNTNNPHWVSGQFAVGRNQWIDVVAYILGSEADVLDCPNLKVNGSSSNTLGLNIFVDGFQIRLENPFVELRVLNSNTSPSFGDDTTTTLRTTDLRMRRIDTEGSLFAAIQVETSVRATETGELNALYAVNVELTTGGDPFVTGFGLAADVIDGLPTSAFGIRADQFFIVSPTFGTAPGDPSNSAFPFVIDLVDGNAQVAIDGTLIVDGTIRAESIVADSIGAREINVTSLQALTTRTGTLLVDRLTTGSDGTVPDFTDQTQFRVELESTVSSLFPIWYGSDAKTQANGLFYVDAFGNVTVKGLLDAAMIKQSFFTPAGPTLDPFRIATQYPSFYSGGSYTGKIAHLFPIFTHNERPDVLIFDIPPPVSSFRGHSSGFVTFLGPVNSSSTQYGRLGTLSEPIHLDVSISASIQPLPANDFITVAVQFRYDGGAWRTAFKWIMDTGTVTTVFHKQIFVTRGTTFQTVDFRMRIDPSDTVAISLVEALSITASAPNVGTSDALITNVPDNSQVEGLPLFPRWT